MERGAIKLADKVQGVIAEMENSLAYMKEKLSKAVSVTDVVIVASDLRTRFIENKYRAGKILDDQLEEDLKAIEAHERAEYRKSFADLAQG